MRKAESEADTRLQCRDVLRQFGVCVIHNLELAVFLLGLHQLFQLEPNRSGLFLDAVDGAEQVGDGFRLAECLLLC